MLQSFDKCFSIVSVPNYSEFVGYAWLVSVISPIQEEDNQLFQV